MIQKVEHWLAVREVISLKPTCEKARCTDIGVTENETIIKVHWKLTCASTFMVLLFNQ